jgi:hypothetical protein
MPHESGLTVADLIERLRRMPPDLPVYCDSGGDAYGPCAGVAHEPDGIGWMGETPGPLVLVHVEGRTTETLSEGVVVPDSGG